MEGGKAGGREGEREGEEREEARLPSYLHIHSTSIRYTVYSIHTHTRTTVYQAGDVFSICTSQTPRYANKSITAPLFEILEEPDSGPGEDL